MRSGSPISSSDEKSLKLGSETIAASLAPWVVFGIALSVLPMSESHTKVPESSPHINQRAMNFKKRLR